jgi:flagellar biosynthesis protein FlhB
MAPILQIIATLAGVILVCWSLIVNPVQDGDSGTQLMGMVLVIGFIALIAAFVVFILPYVAVILLWLLIIAAVLVVTFVLFKIIRPFWPRIVRGLKRLFAFLRRNIPRLLKALWRLTVRAVRALGRVILRTTRALIRWIRKRRPSLMRRRGVRLYARPVTEPSLVRESHHRDEQPYGR